MPKRKRIPDVVARTTRTGAQATGAVVTVQLIEAFKDLPDPTSAALVGFLTVFYSWSQNLIEDAMGKAFLRDMPPEPVEVVEDEATP